METVRYAVAFPRPETHLFELEARLPAAAHGGKPAQLTMPVWTPGSYLLREFSRHVQDVRAFDAGGAPLAVERTDKNTWTVAPPADRGAITVRWRVFARELTVRTSYLDADLAYFNGANLFLTTDSLRAAPVELMVEVPPGRHAVCALQRLAGSAGHTFRARDLDELLDSPVLVSAEEPERFEVRGKPHELVVWGGRADARKLVHDLTHIVEAEADLFGGLPYERYAFLVLLTDKGRGGLEHEASCSLLYPRSGFHPHRAYEDFVQLAAHEVFHLWNVKRIKPAALMPYDYGREQYTSLLWAFEGFTSYYDTLVPLRAGLYNGKRWLESMGEKASDLERTPGRRVASLSEASTCAWVKYYRPDENTLNSTVSYYVKGEVVAMLLDASIRVASAGKRSLDDVMRLLWDRYGSVRRGVPEDGVEAAAIEVGGKDLEAFFRRYVRGTEELPYEDILGRAGITVGRRQREGEQDRGGTPAREKEAAARPWLGAHVKPGDRPVIASVLSGSPAEAAGLSADDELVALGGEKLDAGWLAVLDAMKPGEKLALSYFRRGRLRETTLELGARPADTIWFAPDSGASPEAREILAGWIGELAGS